PVEKLLSEALARFQSCRCFGRTESLPPPPGELIDYAQGQRQFRSDHGKVRMNLGGQRDKRIDALDINRKALGLIGNAAVSRCTINLAHARRLPQLPNQRVLAAAASDH